MTKTNKTYRVETYQADGHTGEDAVVAEGCTLEQARQAIYSEMREHSPAHVASQMDAYRWSGECGGADDERTVEAYHQSDVDGCGGWVIFFER